MLRIRKEQFDVFQPLAETDFVVRIEEHLRKEHENAIVRLPGHLTLVGRMTVTSLRELVQTGIARARSHGFTFASSISAFVVLMVKAAPNFDAHPVLREALTETGPEEQRLKRLLSAASPAVWQETRDQYDPTAWVQDSKRTQE